MKGGDQVDSICHSHREGANRTEAALLDCCLARVAGRDREALAELYQRTRTSVYGFALSILKNTQDAEDVLHDCYVNLYAAAAGYRSSGKPMAWILTITRNLCLMKLRERQKTAGLPREDWERYLDSREEITPEDRLVLTQCMRRLNDQERQIVVLHAVSGFKHREIAELMELPVSTVLSKYRRALKKLRQSLEEGE